MLAKIRSVRFRWNTDGLATLGRQAEDSQIASRKVALFRDAIRYGKKALAVPGQSKELREDVCRKLAWVRKSYREALQLMVAPSQLMMFEEFLAWRRDLNLGLDGAYVHAEEVYTEAVADLHRLELNGLFAKYAGYQVRFPPRLKNLFASLRDGHIKGYEAQNALSDHVAAIRTWMKDYVDAQDPVTTES